MLDLHLRAKKNVVPNYYFFFFNQPYFDIYIPLIYAEVTFSLHKL